MLAQLTSQVAVIHGRAAKLDERYETWLRKEPGLFFFYSKLSTNYIKKRRISCAPSFCFFGSHVPRGPFLSKDDSMTTETSDRYAPAPDGKPQPNPADALFNSSELLLLRIPHIEDDKWSKEKQRKKGFLKACRPRGFSDLVREKLPHVSTTELAYGQIFATAIECF